MLKEFVKQIVEDLLRKELAGFTKQTYKVGDWITVGEGMGKVESVYFSGEYRNVTNTPMIASHDGPVYKVRHFSRNVDGILQPTDSVSYQYSAQMKAYEYDEDGNRVKKEEEPEELNEQVMEKEDVTSHLQVFRKEDGVYWVGVYSGRQLDNHKDLVTNDAHMRYAQRVKSGELPYPELWLMHKLRIGSVTMIDYDEDAGFAIAGGKFDKEWEDDMEELLKKSPENGYRPAMSHTFFAAIEDIDYEGLPEGGVATMVKDYVSTELTLTTRPALKYTAFGIA